MPPKKSSVKRASKPRAGKDDESKVTETHQQSLEEASAGQKRDNPIELDDDAESKGTSKDSTDNVTQQDVQAPGRKDGQRATKRQKQEAAEKEGLESAEKLDEKSEEAKAKGREIKEDENVETRKPARGTLGKLLQICGDRSG